MSPSPMDEADAYIEDLRCAMNEHGVERMEDLPASVLARFKERGLANGMLEREGLPERVEAFQEIFESGYRTLFDHAKGMLERTEEEGQHGQ